MIFKYFKGPIEDMSALINQKSVCSICGDDGKALFMSMTDDDVNHLWDDSLPENDTILKGWYPTYYVFKCLHCGKMRGNWDCD